MSAGAQPLLATFSNTIRNSTLKRLRKVPQGAENWAPFDGGMSFADLAFHIIECDVALLRAIESRQMDKNLGTSGAMPIGSRPEFETLLERLKELKEQRFRLIAGLTNDQLNVIVEADRIRGIEHIPFGGLIMETLDHEIHHRGQLSTYLRVYAETHQSAAS